MSDMIFYLVLIIFIQTFKDLMEIKYCPLIPTLLLITTGDMIKIEMNFHMFNKKQLLTRMSQKDLA